MATSSILNHYFSGRFWFVGDWNPSPIDYERLRGGWFKNGRSEEDIEDFIGLLASIHTIPEEANEEEYGITADGEFIGCRELRQLAMEAIGNLKDLTDLSTISEVIKAMPEGNERTTAGILFLAASSLIARDGYVIIGEESGVPIATTFKLDTDNWRTINSWGEMLAFSYSFNHLFWGFYPFTVQEWLGGLDSSFSEVREDVTTIVRSQGVRDAWLEDIRERRAFTAPALSEVVMGGFWGSLLLAEEKGKLYFLLKSKNGCVSGIIDLDDGSSNICLKNMLQFYSEDEAYKVFEEDAAEEMEATRKAIDLLAIGA